MVWRGDVGGSPPARGTRARAHAESACPLPSWLFIVANFATNFFDVASCHPKLGHTGTTSPPLPMISRAEGNTTSCCRERAVPARTSSADDTLAGRSHDVHEWTYAIHPAQHHGEPHNHNFNHTDLPANGDGHPLRRPDETRGRHAFGGALDGGGQPFAPRSTFTNGTNTSTGPMPPSLPAPLPFTCPADLVCPAPACDAALHARDAATLPVCPCPGAHGTSTMSISSTNSKGARE